MNTQHKHIEKSVNDLLVKGVPFFMGKVDDYGTQDILDAGQMGVLARLKEKILRAENLIKRGTPASNEPLKDTFQDLMWYSMILLLLENGDWREDNNLDGIFLGREDTSIKPEILRGGENISKTEKNKQSVILIKKTGMMGGIQAPKKLGDVGYDLASACSIVIPPFDEHDTAVLVPSGVSIKMPEGYWCQIVGRSSSANKKGLLVVNATIDNGYTGELCACVFNMTNKPIEIDEGERLAQVVFHRMEQPSMMEVDELPETERGESGYGSTGK